MHANVKCEIAHALLQPAIALLVADFLSDIALRDRLRSHKKKQSTSEHNELPSPSPVIIRRRHGLS